VSDGFRADPDGMGSAASAPGPDGAPLRSDEPTSTVLAAVRLVDDAFAAVLLDARGRAHPVRGVPGHELLVDGTDLLAVLSGRSRDALRASFLWPRHDDPQHHGFVRVTTIALPGSVVPDVRALVLLSPPGDLLGLTVREVEVLGLLVDGCSNTEIADALVVSARTVATHVEHLLVKLSCSSRTHAAVRALREGLYVPALRAPGR
jgi:DNA-binding CsgD family transcriptional regulator